MGIEGSTTKIGEISLGSKYTPKHSADISSSFLFDVPSQVPCAPGASSPMLSVCDGTCDEQKELRAIRFCGIAVYENWLNGYFYDRQS